MDNKKVLLIESGYFLGGVIHNLLESKEDLTVIEAQPKTGRELIETIYQYQPDVIILDDTIDFDCMDELMAYLRKNDAFRVVIVCTDSNHIEVYQKNQIAVHQSSDLFDMILDHA